MNTIELGPLSFTLHRTVKVKENEEGVNLPPSLGHFDIFKVADFNCPKSWDKDSYFIAMHQQEAMWISFQTAEPLAIMVGAGSINAVNGEEFSNKLKKDGYLVSPPQPWLDGWKGDDGNVYQFIATEVGENKTVGEQLTETKDHSLVISVFKAKNPDKLKSSSTPYEMWGNSEMGGLCGIAFAGCNLKSIMGHSLECCDSLAGGANLSCEMGVGKGGKIKQKIYEDPYGIKEWKEEPEKTIKIYLINASEFAEITGQVLPLPVSSDQYNGIWYGLFDKDKKDVPGTTVFDKLKSAI